MTPQDDETLWRNRFIAINLIRIGGTILALVGVYLSLGETAREGLLFPGLALAVLGVVISFAGPVWLSRRWRTPPDG